jgi:hypothetical protein
MPFVALGVATFAVPEVRKLVMDNNMNRNVHQSSWSRQPKRLNPIVWLVPPLLGLIFLHAKTLSEFKLQSNNMGKSGEIQKMTSMETKSEPAQAFIHKPKTGFDILGLTAPELKPLEDYTQAFSEKNDFR